MRTDGQTDRQTDRQAERHEEVDIRFSQFSERALSTDKIPFLSTLSQSIKFIWLETTGAR